MIPFPNDDSDEAGREFLRKINEQAAKLLNIAPDPVHILTVEVFAVPHAESEGRGFALSCRIQNHVFELSRETIHEILSAIVERMEDSL
jgi:hypothetical protein